MAWDQISDDSKRSVMFACKDRALKPSIEPTPIAEQPRLSVNFNEVDNDSSDDAFEDAQQSSIEDSSDQVDLLINQVTGRANMPASDPRPVLHQPKSAPGKPNLVTHSKKPPDNRQAPDSYGLSKVEHHVANCNMKESGKCSLVDRGANGGLAGKNVRIIAVTDRRVNVNRINNHKMTDLKIVTCGAVASAHLGDVIFIMHQHAHVPNGKTIHSSIQLEHFGHQVDEKSSEFGGTQTLTTLEGHECPLDIRNGLACIMMRPFMNSEWNDLPHIVLASDEEWDPSCADNVISEDNAWFCALEEHDNDHFFDSCDAFGDLQVTVETNSHESPALAMKHGILVKAHQVRPKWLSSHQKHADCFLGASSEVIQRTFMAATQFACLGWISGHVCNAHQSPFPALNIPRRNAPVAADTACADVPAVDNGSTSAQFFCGAFTCFVAIHGVVSDSHFIKTLWEEIRRRGAVDQLMSDRAQVEISKKTKDAL